MNHARTDQLPADVQAEYPFEGKLFEQPAMTPSGAAAQMHYLDEGEGPVVLMLHGNPTWSFFYRNLLKTLVTAGFRCIVPDHIGCGLSDKPQDYPYTLARRIEDIERLIDHLAIERFSLVVHDWGGAIGCGFATRRPNGLDKLVVLNTAAFCSKRIPLRIAAVKIPIIGEAIIRGLNGFAGPAVHMAVSMPLPPSVKAGYLWPYQNWVDRIAVWNFVKDIPLHKRHPSYSTLIEIDKALFKLADKPVQIVWGGNDFCFNHHFYNEWRARFTNAQNCLHEKCGHYILEEGGSLVLKQIEFFLNA